MMFGTFAEQRHFTYPQKESYHGIFINANMAAYAPDGIAKFIQTKTSPPNRYIIDPQTHAFQHNPKHIQGSNDQLKKSIVNLVEQYGDPIKGIAGERPLSHRDMTPPNQILLVENCIRFQRDFLKSRMESSEDRKYTTFESYELTMSPYALIAPYFFLQETTYNNWLEININLVDQTINKLESGEMCFAMVVLGRGILTNSEAFDEIVSKYRETNVHGFIVWIDDLPEFDSGSAELNGLLKLACKLNAGCKEVINLHGSYFSVLATNPNWKQSSFTGVCHGPEFGEYRSVVPVGGGIPIAKFYIPSLHNRVRYKEAVNLFRGNGYLKSADVFYKNVCNCDECRKNIKNDPEKLFIMYGESSISHRRTKFGIVSIEYPTAETKLRCLRHYLQRKNIEYINAKSKSLYELKNEIDYGISEFCEDYIGYLSLWKKSLWEILNKPATK